MKKQTGYFILAFLVILLSVPLGRGAVGVIYLNKNLASEYIHLVKSFINSFKLIGLLLFILGLLEVYKGRDNKKELH